MSSDEQRVTDAIAAALTGQRFYSGQRVRVIKGGARDRLGTVTRADSRAPGAEVALADVLLDGEDDRWTFRQDWLEPA